ncbi:hypothetical protein DYB32_010755 [Aphanomyces invadans]|uniref:PX domain-containing protein n=1 Tax=Aphanomyces invadans TaxID=157072 RepID=A0A3R6YQT3_9STRA|nr:hypothetical protein DYB32_010755 [Aphanomyces invadans]
MSLPTPLQATLDLALTVGAASAIVTVLAFIVWCTYRAGSRHRIQAAIPKPTSSAHALKSTDGAVASLQPTSVQVTFSRDTLPIAGSYVVYTIELVYASRGASPLKIVLEKRYSDFDHLASHVKKQAKALHVDMPVALPRKTLLFNSSDTFLEQRRHGLQEFLVHLTRHPVLSQLVCVREFCRLD